MANHYDLELFCSPLTDDITMEDFDEIIINNVTYRDNPNGLIATFLEEK